MGFFSFPTQNCHITNKENFLLRSLFSFVGVCTQSLEDEKEEGEEEEQQQLCFLSQCMRHRFLLNQ